MKVNLSSNFNTGRKEALRMAHFVKLENGTYLNVDLISCITANNKAYTLGDDDPRLVLTNKDVENILNATGYFKNGYSK